MSQEKGTKKRLNKEARFACLKRYFEKLYIFTKLTYVLSGTL